MAEVHGSETVILVARVIAGVPEDPSHDISEDCNTSTWPKVSTTEDLSTYGSRYTKNQGSMKNPTLNLGGVFSDTATTSPGAILDGHEGEQFEITRRIKGTGATLPQAKVTMTLANYTESIPSNGFIRWTADFVSFGPIDRTPQS